MGTRFEGAGPNRSRASRRRGRATKNPPQIERRGKAGSAGYVPAPQTAPNSWSENRKRHFNKRCEPLAGRRVRRVVARCQRLAHSSWRPSDRPSIQQHADGRMNRMGARSDRIIDLLHTSVDRLSIDRAGRLVGHRTGPTPAASCRPGARLDLPAVVCRRACERQDQATRQASLADQGQFCGARELDSCRRRRVLGPGAPGLLSKARRPLFFLVPGRPTGAFLAPSPKGIILVAGGAGLAN